jgi:hypothetical protein
VLVHLHEHFTGESGFSDTWGTGQRHCPVAGVQSLAHLGKRVRSTEECRQLGAGGRLSN